MPTHDSLHLAVCLIGYITIRLERGDPKVSDLLQRGGDMGCGEYIGVVFGGDMGCGEYVGGVSFIISGIRVRSGPLQSLFNAASKLQVERHFSEQF